MSVVDWSKHLRENQEELVIGSRLGDFRSVRAVLRIPVNAPQCKKWVSVVEGSPEGFEILFRIMDEHSCHDGAPNAVARPHIRGSLR